MKKIELNEIKNIYEYEKIRKEYREKIIAEKKYRRMTIGENITIILKIAIPFFFKFRK
jgi:hypothetical protein